MRYSGLRISDAVQVFPEKIDHSGNLFLYMAKTGHPIKLPLPSIVLEALYDIPEREDDDDFFLYRNGKLKSELTDWQMRLKRVFRIAHIPTGHSHRLRDTFSVDLLSKGVSLQTVSILLGHQSIKTTEKHYAPFVQATQLALDEAVKKTWTMSW